MSMPRIFSAFIACLSVHMAVFTATDDTKVNVPEKYTSRYSCNNDWCTYDVTRIKPDQDIKILFEYAKNLAQKCDVKNIKFEQNNVFDRVANFLHQIIGNVVAGVLPYNADEFNDYKALLLEVLPYIGDAYKIKKTIGTVLHYTADVLHDVDGAKAYGRSVIDAAVKSQMGSFVLLDVLDPWIWFNYVHGSLPEAITYVRNKEKSLQDNISQIFETVKSKPLNERELADFLGFVSNACVFDEIICFMSEYAPQEAIEYGKSSVSLMKKYYEEMVPFMVMNYDCLKQLAEQKSLEEQKDCLKECICSGNVEGVDNEFVGVLLAKSKEEFIEDYQRGVVEGFIEAYLLVVEVMYRSGDVQQASAYLKELYNFLKQKGFNTYAEGVKELVSDPNKAFDQKNDFLVEYSFDAERFWIDSFGPYQFPTNVDFD